MASRNDPISEGHLWIQQGDFVCPWQFEQRPAHADKMKSENRDRPGHSFWVGEMSDVASHSFRDVNTMQQSVIGLAEHVKGLEW
jgi:hypothetical protein